MVLRSSAELSKQDKEISTVVLLIVKSSKSPRWRSSKVDDVDFFLVAAQKERQKCIDKQSLEKFKEKRNKIHFEI